MLQTMLSMSSGATKDTVAACQAVSVTLEISLPPSVSKTALREEIAIKLAGAAEVARAVRFFISFLFSFPARRLGSRYGVGLCKR